MSRRLRQRLLAGLAVVALGASAAAAALETLLVGLVVNGREVASLEVFRAEGSFWLPLEPLAEALSLDVVDAGAAPRLATPLGEATVSGVGTALLAGGLCVTPGFLERELAIRADFDDEEYALRLETPWNGAAAYRDLPELEVDAEPPAAGLSTLRGDLLFVRQGDSESRFGGVLATGRVADGWWRARLDDDFSGNQQIQEYAWIRTFGNRMMSLGKQDVRLHPLLGDSQFTGVQLAWTNQPLDIFPSSFEARELLPRRVQPRTTFRGRAPVGTIAELRIDGRVIARQGVGLGGEYEFVDTPMPARGLSRVEVFILDPTQPGVPLAIHDQEVSSSEFLLSRGATVHLGGVGQSGNALQSLLDDDDRETDDHLFYQWRHGLSDRLTLEAAAEGDGDDAQLLAGLVSRLGSSFVVSAAAGSARGELGYSLELEGERGDWRFSGRSNERPAGFLAEGSSELSDDFFEILHRPDPTVRWSIIGSDRREVGGRTRYLLPALTWQPDARLSFRARPQFDGDYRLDLSYLASTDLRLVASYEDSFVGDLSYRIGRRHRLSFGTEFGSDVPTRFSAIFSRLSLGGRGATWSAGAIFNEDMFGFLAAGTVPLFSGWLARVEYQSTPLTSRLGPDLSERFLIGLTLDVAHSRGSFVPANTLSLRRNRGAIAGRLRVGDERLAGERVPILVDGRPVTQTEADGTFFIGNLERGVYQVELDAEHLPIELLPLDPTVVAEVAGGAVTRVGFELRAEYGIAGRVTGAGGVPQPSVRVLLLDAAGEVVGRAVTDRYGLYRIDRVPPGSYRLRVASETPPEGDSPPAERPVEVDDSFLFGQDLDLEASRRRLRATAPALPTIVIDWYPTTDVTES